MTLVQRSYAVCDQCEREVQTNGDYPASWLTVQVGRVMRGAEARVVCSWMCLQETTRELYENAVGTEAAG